MTPARRQIRIMLVDDHNLFRESVARLLEAEPDLVVAGSYDSSDEALRHLAADLPDVVLLDFDLGETNGSRFLEGTLASGFRGKVLVVTAGVTKFESAELIRRGIAGIVLKHSSPANLARSIRNVAEGAVCLDQEELRSALELPATIAFDGGRRTLTSREVTILHHVFDGLTNKEIGREVGISESAVKASLQQLFEKTGVRTRSQLVRIVLEEFRDQL
jgi:two-component system, NarL family, nitrate/nitrite response regulator NarL